MRLAVDRMDGCGRVNSKLRRVVDRMAIGEVGRVWRVRWLRYVG